MQFRSKFEPLASDATEKAVLLAGFVLSFIVLLVSLEDIGRYAGIDFRNRIVGARVLLTGQDPYTFEWQPGMPVELLDPCHDARVHRLTAPPPTLFLYAAIAELPYKVERLISCLLEWAAFIVCAFVLTRTIAVGQKRFLFLAATTVFFVLSFFWRAHLERGQVYVFHLLLLSCAVRTLFARKSQFLERRYPLWTRRSHAAELFIGNSRFPRVTPMEDRHGGGPDVPAGRVIHTALHAPARLAKLSKSG